MATEGNTTDFKFIEAEILALASRFVVTELAYDRTFAGEIVCNLQDEGLSLVEFGQGFLSMGPASAEFLRLLTSGSCSMVATRSRPGARHRRDFRSAAAPDREPAASRPAERQAWAREAWEPAAHGRRRTFPKPKSFRYAPLTALSSRSRVMHPQTHSRLVGSAEPALPGHLQFLVLRLAVCGKTGKFEVLPFRYGALCWWFSRLDRHKRLFLVSLRSSPMRQPISGCGSGCRR